jgi:hypothetical protein
LYNSVTINSEDTLELPEIHPKPHLYIAVVRGYARDVENDDDELIRLRAKGPISGHF